MIKGNLINLDSLKNVTNGMDTVYNFVAGITIIEYLINHPEYANI